jgi:DNA transposition AAA+ family ATPase
MSNKSVSDMNENEKTGLDMPAGESLSTIALATGLSKTTVSRVMAGNYPTDSDGYRKVLEYLRGKGHLRDPDAPAPVPGEAFTTVGQKLISAVLEAAIEDGEWVILDGPSGLGKSHCVKAFRERHPDALVMRAMYGQAESDVLRDLCRLLELPVSGTNGERKRRVLDSVKGKILLVDEADLWVEGSGRDRVLRVMELFRQIYEHDAAVILMGLPILTQKLSQWGESYVFSRIGYFRSIKAPTQEEMAEFFVRRTADMPEVHHKAGLAASQARKHGLLRYLDKLARRTRTLGGDVEGAMTLLFRPEGA